eukprot:g63106.t1
MPKGCGPIPIVEAMFEKNAKCVNPECGGTYGREPAPADSSIFPHDFIVCSNCGRDWTMLFQAPSPLGQGTFVCGA